MVVFIINGLNIPLNDTDVFKFEHVLQKHLTTYDIIEINTRNTLNGMWIHVPNLGIEFSLTKPNMPSSTSIFSLLPSNDFLLERIEI